MEIESEYQFLENDTKYKNFENCDAILIKKCLHSIHVKILDDYKQKSYSEKQNGHNLIIRLYLIAYVLF